MVCCSAAVQQDEKIPSSVMRSADESVNSLYYISSKTKLPSTRWALTHFCIWMINKILKQALCSKCL